jgi:hypothetical protein
MIPRSLTGAARRIGRQIALALGRAGAGIALTYRSSERDAEHTMAQLAEIGVDALAARCDIRDPLKVRETVAEVVHQMGRLDILVNNAAVYETVDFEKLTVEQWDAMFQTNVRGAFLVSQAAAPALRRARVLMRFRELLDAHKKELAKIVTQEHGKTLADAEGSITRGIEVVEFATGIPQLLKGEFSERTLAISNQLGYKTIFWSFAYVDWDTKNQKGAQNAFDTVMDYIHGGAIILLHAVSKDNADAMDSILKECKKQGYTFKSLTDLK